MANIIVEKYKDLVPLNEEPSMALIFADVTNMSPTEQKPYWILEEGVGRVFVYRHHEYPGKVLEYVQGTQDDSVSTLYREHRIFNSLADLIRARKELINEIGAHLMMLPSTVLIYDAGRERDAYLAELGTAQLLDMLVQITGEQIRGVTYGKQP